VAEITPTENDPAVPRVEVGARVVTADGPGVVVGWHTSRTWIFQRLEVRAYVVVDLDGGGRRLYPNAALKVEAPAR
jgi:hypothetical protein